MRTVASTQESLDAVFRAAKQVRVSRPERSGGRTLDPVVVATEQPSEIEALREALRIQEGSAARCLCKLMTELSLRDAAGHELASIWVHGCNRAIQWDRWTDHASLLGTWPLIDWLDAHGMPCSVSEGQIRERSLSRIAAFLGSTFESVGRGIYATADRGTIVTLGVSIRDSDGMFHSVFRADQQAILEGAARAYVAFACASPHRVLVIPYAEFAGWLPALPRVSVTGGESFWRLQMREGAEGLCLQGLSAQPIADLQRFLLP